MEIIQHNWDILFLEYFYISRGGKIIDDLQVVFCEVLQVDAENPPSPHLWFK